MRRAPAIAFLTIGLVFLAMTATGRRGFTAIGFVFIAIGVVFLVRQRRARRTR